MQESGDGVDGVWLQDGNGNYLANAGGGSGNDLQMTSNGATAFNTGGNESGVPGVYVFVFSGNPSKMFSSAKTATSGNPGSLSSLSGVTIGLAIVFPSQNFTLFTDADIVELLNGFAPCVTGLTIGA